MERGRRDLYGGFCLADLLDLVTMALLLVGSAAGCRGHAPPPRSGLAPPPLPVSALPGVWHTVASGETLAELARRYGLPLQDLAEINDLADPDVLSSGQELFVPGAGRVLGPGEEAAQASSPEAAAADRAGAGLDRPQGLFRWPVSGARLTSRFGRRWGRQHDGVDLAAPSGTPIHAAAAGTVIYAGPARGYGNVVLVEHDGRFVTVYAHNDENLVEEGQVVRQGEAIAQVGSTGHSTGPHCHFEVRDGGKPRNPLFFLELSTLEGP